MSVSAPGKRKADAKDAGDSDSGSDVDMISVDFVFNAPSDIDFDALKRLFIQLFYTHAPRLDAGQIADYIINTSKQRELGTVIKVSDDGDNDPFAVVSAASISSETPAPIKQITDLLLECIPKTQALHVLLQQACSASASSSQTIGFILHERMINLPPAVASPLYRLLDEELTAAYEKGTAPKPSHYLLFSRVFSAEALSSDEDMDGDDSSKRGKRRKKTAPVAGKSALTDDELGLFHPEDQIIAKYASHSHVFRFPAPKDASESFESPLFGKIVAVPREKWSAAIKEMERAFQPAAN